MESAYSEEFNALSRLARLSSFLAKQLKGQERALAYRIKAEALSALILQGGASVNGICPTGIVALDLYGTPPSRVHVPRAHLSPAARALVDGQAASAPAVARLPENAKSLFADQTETSSPL